MVEQVCVVDDLFWEVNSSDHLTEWDLAVEPYSSNGHSVWSCDAWLAVSYILDRMLLPFGGGLM